jgi:hypothetical protein
MTRFLKNEIVYKVSTDFATVGKASYNEDKYISEVRLGIIVERQVESCGAKRITFYDRANNDFVFGKSAHSDNETYFKSVEDAFNFLKNSNQCQVICPDVYSDADNKSFDDFNNGKMRIAQK